MVRPKGSGKARAAVAANGGDASVEVAEVASAATSSREQESLSAADRENPDKLTGEALRALAHRRGVARSEADVMSDDKLRMQLRYITNRQYTEEE